MLAWASFYAEWGLAWECESAWQWVWAAEKESELEQRLRLGPRWVLDWALPWVPASVPAWQWEMGSRSGLLSLLEELLE